jgi:metal-responsive CopG/Arc/MetJ family transcriptional regulator
MKENFIPSIPSRTVVSIRLEDELLENIDTLAKKQKMSRNELIKQCIVFALSHIDEKISKTK